MKSRSLAAMLIAAALSGCGLTASSLNPGYAVFDSPQEAGLERETSLSLGPALLRMAAGFVDDDPETRELLRALDGVQVAVYRVGPEANPAAIAARLARDAAALRGRDWQAVVRIQEPGSRVHVLARTREQRLLGLAVMAVDDEELVYLNVMGDVTPAQLTGIAAALPRAGNGPLAALSGDPGWAFPGEP